MRPDLRKLLARFRVGLVRRDVLAAAVERVCGDLVTERFEGDPGLQESSRFARPLLGRFEDEIARALLWAPAGEAGRAVRAVEGAVQALVAVHRIARAHAEWEACRKEWRELRASTGLARLAALPTGRTIETMLALAERALDAGESRKARFLTMQCRQALRRLGAVDPDDDRRRRLERRIGANPPPEPEVARLLEQWVADRRLDLAERIWVDWWITVDAPHDAAVRSVQGGGSPRLRELAAVEREAGALAPILAEIGGSSISHSSMDPNGRGDRS